MAEESARSGKLAIIGAARYRHSTVRSLIHQAEQCFETVLFVPITKLRLSSVNGANHLYYKDVNLLAFDACYPRIRAKDHAMGEALLDILDHSPVYSPVTLKGFQLANHKYYTVQHLAKAGVPVVLSALSASPEGMEAVKKKLGLPLVIKLISGFAGKGVVLVENEARLRALLDALHLFEECISSQAYVEGANTDIRCYVLGEQVIAVRRYGSPGDFRANISRGGRAERIRATPRMKAIALRAARAMAMDICAVDLIALDRAGRDYAVIEVNFQPGPFMKYLGETITRAMVRFIHEKIAARARRSPKRSPKR